MTRDKFELFVDKTLNEVVQNAEIYSGNKLPTDFILEDYNPASLQTIGRNNVIQEICNLVFISQDKIFPCVNLTADRIQDNFLVIKLKIAGYDPRPFQNGVRREGPFVYGVNQNLIHQNTDINSEEFIQRLKDSGLYPNWTQK